MKEKSTCPLCNAECELDSSYHGQPLKKLFSISCKVCGQYDINQMAKDILYKRKDYFHIISGVSRNFYELHKNPNRFFVITEEMIDDDIKFQAEFLSKTPKSYQKKQYYFYNI